MADLAPISYDDFAAEQETAKIPFQVKGTTFHIIPPELMSDDDATAFYDLIAKKPEDAAGSDVVALARLVIDDYDGFSELGGTAGRLVAYMQTLTEARNAALKAEQGVDEGEGAAS